MQVFPDYISKLNYYLHVMSDDGLDDFYINDLGCRAKLFDAMKADFDRFGAESQQRTLDAIEFILSSGDIEKYWRAVVPHEVPLDEVEDKPDYLRSLYEKLAGRAPSPRNFGSDVEIVYGRHSIDARR
ncbi:hypothetical protein [Variovorax paradoxus]|uniref:CdiI immunity protein domain-containing protein n=1 Tax=Variovorax paradoxus TaxID=34073 RepID=A0A0H2MKP1_VARPD|nr:hypothetical protein [Variovorax paradoxus]KLN57360.1 hypothetical protein VPARA_14400 [Variovorax paradoxus]